MFAKEKTQEIKGGGHASWSELASRSKERPEIEKQNDTDADYSRPGSETPQLPSQ